MLTASHDTSRAKPSSRRPAPPARRQRCCSLDGLAIAERLTHSDLGNAGWQRDLSVAYEKVGDVQPAQGDLGGALKFYRDSLAISERLARSDPNNAAWQRDLAVCAGTRGAQELFGLLLGELRPKLHRYCARTTGSVLDGEGILQHRPQPPQD